MGMSFVMTGIAASYQQVKVLRDGMQVLEARRKIEGMAMKPRFNIVFGPGQTIGLQNETVNVEPVSVSGYWMPVN